MKILYTQTFFAVFSICCFYTLVPLMQGNGLDESVKELRFKLWPTMLANWKVWPIFHVFNFTLVPTQLQPAGVAFFFAVFSVYLSFMKFVVKRPDQEPLKRSG